MRISVLAIAAGLVLAMPAQADAGWRINRATAIADAVWGPATCGPLRITMEVPAEDWYEELGDMPMGWGSNGDCELHITVAAKRRGWVLFCDTVVHETGHVHGYEHDHRGHHGVMLDRAVTRDTATFPNGRRVTRWGGIHPACLHRGRPFLERHGLLRDGQLTQRVEDRVR